METPHRIPVLLLKTQSNPSDAYEEYFSTIEGGLYHPIFVPVLQHRFNDDTLNELQSHITTGSFTPTEEAHDARTRYGGIIFTSQRAVDAFASVVQLIRDELGCADDILPAGLPLYAVGPATARGLRTLSLRCPILGEETGNGDALAAFILRHYNGSRSSSESPADAKLPLLFLVGEQRRDVIPRTLASAGMAVHEMVVYETGEMLEFRDNFRAVWSGNLERGCRVQWIVVFSPTGSKALLETLGILDPGADNAEQGASVVEDRSTFVVTIGPTTRDYMKREFGFAADACAAVPSPEGVASAIKSFMEESKVLQ